MTTALAKKAGLKVFQQHLQTYTPIDPLYETYTDPKGRTKRRKRELPPGLSKRDAAVLRSVNRRAHYLDKGFSICGFRFGWTFIIGIIPGAGDVADASLNYFLVVRKARKAEIPAWLLRKMLANNAVSAGVGLVPIVGDVFLATYKANSRNAALLHEFLAIRGAEFLAIQAGGAAPNAAETRPGAGLKAGERIVAPKRGEAVPESLVPEAQRASTSAAPAPAPAAAPPGGKSRSWFGRSKKEKQADAAAAAV